MTYKSGYRPNAASTSSSSSNNGRAMQNNMNPLPPPPVGRPSQTRRDRLEHNADVELNSLPHGTLELCVPPRPDSREGSFSRPFNRVATADSTSSIPVSLPSRNVTDGHSSFDNPFADPGSLHYNGSGHPYTAQSQTSLANQTLAEQRTGTNLAPIITGHTSAPRTQQQSRFFEEPLTPAPGPPYVEHQSGEPGVVEAALRDPISGQARRPMSRLKLSLFLGGTTLVVLLIAALVVAVHREMKRTAN